MTHPHADAGGNFIDTSDAYQQGQSELAIGAFVTANRDDFVIASKYSRGSRPEAGIAARGAHRKAMIQSVEASLKRLKTDRIDLYLNYWATHPWCMFAVQWVQGERSARFFSSCAHVR